MRWCRLDTKLFALCIRVLVTTKLVVSRTQCIQFIPISSGGSRIFPRRGRQLPKTYYFPNYLLKTAWIWKNLDPPPQIHQWFLWSGVANICNSCTCCRVYSYFRWGSYNWIPGCIEDYSCCQCLEEKCECGTAKYKQGSKEYTGCDTCGCFSPRRWHSSKNQYQCDPCFPSTARVSLENGESVNNVWAENRRQSTNRYLLFQFK